MIRGTRYLLGDEAAKFHALTNKLSWRLAASGFMEFIPSALADQALFINKAGPKIVNQMFSFPDKKSRPICLVPEITAVVQKLYKEDWSKRLPKPIRIYYLARCYRYERPQEGRYREFWQFGVEELGGNLAQADMIVMLKQCLDGVHLRNYEVKESVKRGLDYYVEDGFEIEAPILGAQKQVAGGGRYDCGIGFAIGVDRLLLALEKERASKEG